MPGKARPPLIDMALSRQAPHVDYPFDLPCVRHLGVLAFHPAVTYLVGENGSGKSTLIEALAQCCGLNVEGGNRNTVFNTHQTASLLWKHLELRTAVAGIRSGFFFRAETLYNLFTKAEEEKRDPHGWHVYGWSDRHQASHGEGHIRLFKEKVQGDVLIFDEPEAALSPHRQLAFLALIRQWIQQGSQVIIATHSPIILSYPDAWIYGLDSGPLQRIAYEECACVQVMEAFMQQRQRMVSAVLADPDEPT
ncbi:MAG: AAA family ATPase [Planctomycetota bacterium]|nr:MAG: AAA family ATPase [Planctomycetota bacterium]